MPDNVNTILNIVQLVAFVGGGFVAVLLTMQRLTEIRDGVLRLNGRVGQAEQRISKLEGKTL